MIKKELIKIKNAIQQNDSEKKIKSEKDKQRTIDFFTKLTEDPSPKVTISEHDKISPEPDTLAKVSEALGTTDVGVMSHFMNQVVNSFPINTTRENKNNNALSILYGIKPKDELESMLAMQMIGVHNLAMEFMARANYKEQTPIGVDANVNRATKLLRTYTAQIEALNRYRGNTQQKMTVEHVHVHEGGQAIVGNINQPNGEGVKNEK